MNIEDFIIEMRYALNRFDWGNSPLDARAIAFLNIWVKELDNLEENT